MRWTPPSGGCYKLNCDAALDHRKEGIMGLGVIVRDYQGRVYAARSLTKRGALEPTVVEALAVFYGIKLCHERGL